MKTVLRVAAMAAVFVSGCTTQAGGTITPLPMASPSPSPSASTACTQTEMRPAQLFALTTPAESTADAPFEATVWTYQNKTPSVAVETALPHTFIATVDTAAKTITFKGSVSAVVPADGAQCAFPMIAGGGAMSVKVNVTAPAGTYKLVLDHYSDQFIVPDPAAPPAAQPGSITIK